MVVNIDIYFTISKCIHLFKSGVIQDQRSTPYLDCSLGSIACAISTDRQFDGLHVQNVVVIQQNSVFAR